MVQMKAGSCVTTCGKSQSGNECAKRETPAWIQSSLRGILDAETSGDSTHAIFVQATWRGRGSHPKVSKFGDRRDARPVLRAPTPFIPTLMPCIHGSLLCVALVVLSAASLSAQPVSGTDSAKVTTLATVTVTAESGNWFTKADDMRKGVIMMAAENQRLARELRRQDAQVEQLTVKLDSLQNVEAAQQAAIATISDSVASTRARRRALEAWMIASEIRQP